MKHQGTYTSNVGEGESRAQNLQPGRLSDHNSALTYVRTQYTASIEETILPELARGATLLFSTPTRAALPFIRLAERM